MIKAAQEIVPSLSKTLWQTFGNTRGSRRSVTIYAHVILQYFGFDGPKQRPQFVKKGQPGSVTSLSSAPFLGRSRTWGIGLQQGPSELLLGSKTFATQAQSVGRVLCSDHYLRVAEGSHVGKSPDVRSQTARIGRSRWPAGQLGVDWASSR